VNEMCKHVHVYIHGVSMQINFIVSEACAC
jgi:hypothetical protein